MSGVYSKRRAVHPHPRSALKPRAVSRRVPKATGVPPSVESNLPHSVGEHPVVAKVSPDCLVGKVELDVLRQLVKPLTPKLDGRAV